MTWCRARGDLLTVASAATAMGEALGVLTTAGGALVDGDATDPGGALFLRALRRHSHEVADYSGAAMSLAITPATAAAGGVEPR
jgi:hypothetical protein